MNITFRVGNRTFSGTVIDQYVDDGVRYYTVKTSCGHTKWCRDDQVVRENSISDFTRGSYPFGDKAACALLRLAGEGS